MTMNDPTLAYMPRSSRSARDELDELLDINLRQVRDYESCAFGRITWPISGSHGRDLILVGAGGLGRYTLDGLRRLDLEPLAFADNNRRLQGTKIQGVPVLSVDEAVARFNDTATFVVTIWGSGFRPRSYLDISDQLVNLNCKRYAPAGKLFWQYPDTFLPYYCLDLPSKIVAQFASVRQAFDLMADEASRREFVAQLRWRMRLNYDCLPLPVKERMYFCHSLYHPVANETFVDCGAYHGDTLQAFLAHQGRAFKRYLAIEPDPINYRGLTDYISGLHRSITSRIMAFPLAVGACRATLRLTPTGSPSTTVGANGQIEVVSVALDDLLTAQACDTTIIKMDIEGAEVDAFRGASRIIGEQSPVLAICVYHVQDHLWTIPNLIHDLNPDYRIYLRPHKGEAWDLVCYAVPPNRRAE